MHRFVPFFFVNYIIINVKCIVYTTKKYYVYSY